MNNQEIFDKVCNHLLTQNQKAVDFDGNCKYRDYNGLKCAVGCLIPDEKYSRSIEGKKMFYIPMQLYADIGIDFHESKLLLEALQNTHDLSEPVMWKEKLVEIGKRFGLTLPECLG